jgi:hypothetical protein
LTLHSVFHYDFLGSSNFLAPYSTADETSFASKTVKGAITLGNLSSHAERWPVLLTKVIADIQIAMKSDGSAESRSEGNKLIRDLGVLKSDMENNRPLR